MWKDEKPTSGDHLPKKALDILNMMESQVSNVKNDYLKCCTVKELLNLELGNPTKIINIEDEINSLKDVW